MSNNTIEIRNFRESDAAHVSTLIRRCWEELVLGDYDPKGIQIQIEETRPEKLIELNDTVKFFVAERGEIIAGFGGYDNELVRLMFVSPEFQRKGIGSLILKCILADANRQGIKKLECNSTIYAVPFYLKHGFIEKGEVDFKNIYFKRMLIKL